MAYLRGFGAYVPRRAVTNEELAERLGVRPEWILEVSGIEQRRYADDAETVISLGTAAGEDCLSKCGLPAGDVSLVIVASGTSEQRFPGPAASVARQLGVLECAAIDLPIASAGSLFGLSLASRLTDTYRNILVIGAEKMSPVISREPLDKNTSVLFGDGAGACLVSADAGKARIVDSLIQSDGAFAGDLRLSLDGRLVMNGRSVIMQASRKIPRAIAQLLGRNGLAASEVEVFLMHQANQNLIDRVAKALDVPTSKFYSNIRRYGNTSSASMLIAASEWWEASGGPSPGEAMCFAAFGAGFHWGAALAVAC